MNIRFRNHAALPHFSRGLRAQRFLKPGLKSTQKVGSHSPQIRLVRALSGFASMGVVEGAAPPSRGA